VVATTWAPEGQKKLLLSRASLLARAIQSWGSCDVSEICGDAFEGTVGTMLAMNMEPPATISVASLSSALYMLPVYRPASPWRSGSMMLRTPDGKPWPYQPGSPLQTTWIDIIYARPGSGKSVLSNAMNFALCMQGGLERLPRISVIDIGPSSAGLVSLVKEALPAEQSHLAAYHRLQMTPEYSINPFDTHLGCRYPYPQERAFLVNFVTLLVTPVGATGPYDGIADMVGMVVDEAYKSLADDGNPNIYTEGINEELDAIIEQIGFVADDRTTWWEVTDALFAAGFTREASLAQRNAMPLVADLTAVARIPAVVDLYGKITIPTGESLINAFVRMISGAVREYPILSRYTQFDLGESKIVSLDLDEVAKSGGDAADRQTAVMYMLARYVLAKDFYINKENLSGLTDAYREHHAKIVDEIREDQKRLVLDEFHRTSKAQAVRDQVIVDMREGRKWRVQIALISQSLDDFSKNMVDFATSIFIMDAGPEQSIRRTQEVFGLSPTAVSALRNYVRGPSAKGANFLAQFATKDQMTTHLLTVTIGPVELWAFSTTAEDVKIRTALYQYLGPKEARTLLARIFPSGSAARYVAMKMEARKQQSGMLGKEEQKGVIDAVVQIIMDEYKKDPEFRVLPA
jgi:intracellular multiplication protein IcmB